MSEDRKGDHIDLAFRAQIREAQIDSRFNYEPMLVSNDTSNVDLSKKFLGKVQRAPFWVSSMTGGTERARIINQNLARVCKEFGFGMGLGSCRPLLDSEEAFNDFNIRPLIGEEQSLYANLGVAQIEELIHAGKMSRISEMISKLQADGLIIHVNPMQEWLQPEGDIYTMSPLDIIKRCLDQFDFSIIVKEVGQGFGPKSMLELLKLPVQAIDFAANGGTNFAKLEMLRADEYYHELYKGLANIGHSAVEMVEQLRDILKNENSTFACQEVIISGGIRTFLDGYYLVERCPLNAVYGQASGFLQHAMDYEALRKYVDLQLAGYKLSTQILTIKAD